MDSSGRKLGRIVHGQAATTNVAFGGADWRTLYFTTRSSLFSVNLKVGGLPVPTKKKVA
jgi:sugar lactone lactonase YvrE